MTSSKLTKLTISLYVIVMVCVVGLPRPDEIGIQNGDPNPENMARADQVHDEGNPDGNTTLTEAQKQQIAILYKGFGPVLGPFPQTDRTESNDLSLDESKLGEVLGNDIDWHIEPDTLSEVDMLRWDAGANPKQIHLSLGNTSTEMVVMWATKDPIPSGIPRVLYGVKENSMTSVSVGNTLNFYRLPEYVPFEPKEPELFFKALQYHHRVVLKDLLPNTTYYYRIDCDHCYSVTHSFKTMPSGQDWSASFLVYGDMGRLHKSPILNKIMEDVATGQHTAVLHVGDFAYDLHNLGGLMGDSFFNQIEPITSRIPYMVCPGNHELDYRQAAVQYVHRFSMPQLPWPMNRSNLWFSFDVANIHFVSYSTEVYFTNTTADEAERQKNWLEQDLTTANTRRNRALRPWIIAFGHRPMYCSNNDIDDCTRNISRVRNGLEELFFKHGVDLIIQAHEHSYERLWPVYKGRVWGYNYTNPGAPVHVIAGAAGCNEQYSFCVDFILGSKGPWSAYHSSLPGLYGYARLQAFNATHLHWEQVLSVNGQVSDSFWVVQHHHGPFSEW